MPPMNETMSELELRQSLERARLNDRQNAHERALAEQYRARDEREAFIAKQNCEFERVQFTNGIPEMLFANGARLMDPVHGQRSVMIDPPTDPREKLLNRQLFLKIRLKKWERQYADQCDYCVQQLAIYRMGAGGPPAGEWKTGLRDFANLLEALIRELNDINQQLFPNGKAADPRAVIRQRAAADTAFLATLPQFTK